MEPSATAARCNLKLTRIRLGGKTQGRVALDEYVAEYAELMSEGALLARANPV